MRELLKKVILFVLVLESKLILKRHKPFIIGVTGNIGKTTTKDSIAAALAELNVRESKKSLNSEWGVPLTIIGESSGWNSPIAWIKIMLKGIKVLLDSNYPDILILEIGADKKSDIRSIVTWLQIDIGVITQFADVPVHVENFKDRNELIREKSYLAHAIKEEGTFVYNSDCKDSVKIAEGIEVRKISFGKRSGDVRAPVIIDEIKNKLVHAQVLMNNKNYTLECLGVIGESAVLCALPALVIATLLKVNIKNSLNNIKYMQRAPGRMKLLPGKFNSTIIDDSYNSSPLAVLHGLKTIGDTNVLGRKIVILGDMLELGEYTKEEHVKIGREVARVAHILVTVGTRARFIAEGALNNGMEEGWILECDDSYEAGREVLNILKENDLVYIKGSQGIRLERATVQLVSETVDVKNSIPRQDPEWLSR